MHTPWKFQNDSSLKARRDIHQKQNEIANLIGSCCLALLQNSLENSFRNTPSALPGEKKNLKKLKILDVHTLLDSFCNGNSKKNERNALVKTTAKLLA